MLTEIGPVQIEVPRDRDAGFAPAIVRKRQRRLDGIDEIVLALTARGLTTGEVAAHLDEIHGAKVSKDTIAGFSPCCQQIKVGPRSGRDLRRHRGFTWGCSWSG